MTREGAMAEALRRQRLHPDAKWVAAERDGQWTVARITLAPEVIAQTRSATRSPPSAPRDDPYSQLEIVTRLYGSIG